MYLSKNILSFWLNTNFISKRGTSCSTDKVLRQTHYTFVFGGGELRTEDERAVWGLKKGDLRENKCPPPSSNETAIYKI